MMSSKYIIVSDNEFRIIKDILKENKNRKFISLRDPNWFCITVRFELVCKTYS